MNRSDTAARIKGPGQQPHYYRFDQKLNTDAGVQPRRLPRPPPRAGDGKQSLLGAAAGALAGARAQIIALILSCVDHLLHLVLV
jgi:hypothetical protein